MHGSTHCQNKRIDHGITYVAQVIDMNAWRNKKVAGVKLAKIQQSHGFLVVNNDADVGATFRSLAKDTFSTHAYEAFLAWDGLRVHRKAPILLLRRFKICA
jgi:hypothetical protein